jgi:hypothetical protein
VLNRLVESWVSVVMVMGNLRIKAWVGLGRFVLQSYEKSELEVEPGRTEHAARCKVPSHQKHRRQSSRKLLYTEAKAKVSLFVPQPINPVFVHAFDSAAARDQSASHPPTYLSFHRSRP